MTSSVAAKNHPYELFMLSLCLFALGALAAETFVRLDPSTKVILDFTDNLVCVLFFVDFLISLMRAPDKWRYLYTWGWIDLLSSLPMLDPLRWGRIARVTRIFRIFRGLKATRILASFVLDRRSEGSFLAVALLSFLLVVFASVAICQFEIGTEGGNIKDAGDALWWAFATITTVGYGDRFPVTHEGRFVAVLLMSAGVGLFGTFSGCVAAWFLGPDKKQQENELESIRSELVAIRQLLEQERKR